jgi:tellurite resistance protein TerA
VPIEYTKRPTSVAPPPPQSPVSLSKVTLTKSAPSVSLTKQGSAGGTLRVNLNWNARQPESGRGLFKRKPGAIDLDLGCLYEYVDGSKGVVQALGNSFRDRNAFGPQPICWLDGDDRSGSNSGGENLFVDLGALHQIRRILIFAYIYEGVPNWAAADAVVSLIPVDGPQIEVRLDEHDDQSTMCAIAMLSNSDAELSVSREVRYVRGGQRTLDQTYGWGMEWSSGRK